MSTRILGTGWVTPLGRGLDEVMQAMSRGEKAVALPLREGSDRPVWRIPTETVADAVAVPRMRRSSQISHYAVAAAKDAVARAGLDEAALAGCALVFAVSDGGVIYTRRFYEDIATKGPGAGSPVLFPETVYNAPASHVAAALGLSGELLTLVGDAAAGLAAIHTGCELLADTSIDYCLVVAAQECDWISVEAYGRWRLLDAAPFAEGAAALVLGRDRGGALSYVHPGFSYATNSEARGALRKILADIPVDLRPGIAISGVAGNAFDRIERDEIAAAFPAARLVLPKLSLGEALAVSALQQVIVADQMLEAGEHALITAAGFNGEISALILTGNEG